jgi:Uma2 family endonuclease
MPIGVPLTDPAFLVALEHQHRLTADDYHRMIAAGIFEEDDRLELLEGVIVEMSPQSPRHALVISRLCDPAFVSPGPQFLVRCQLPLTLGPHSEPEPDVAVVLRTEADRIDRHPVTAALVIEVAGDSLQKDRLTKSATYAAAVIPEYVIVNLAHDCLEVHRDPDPEARRYRTVVTVAVTQRFESKAVEGFAFAAADLLR